MNPLTHALGQQKAPLVPRSTFFACDMHEYIVDKIIETASKHQVKIIFVIIPTKYQIERNSDKNRFENLEKVIGLDPANKLDDRIRTDILRILHKTDTIIFDPYDEFVSYKSANKNLLYYNSDHHLNENGNRILGKFISDKLPQHLPDIQNGNSQ